jgi:hypothetical protein
MGRILFGCFGPDKFGVHGSERLRERGYRFFYPAIPLCYPLISDQYAVQYKLGIGVAALGPLLRRK